MNLRDVYEMPVQPDGYTKLTPHDDCVLAKIESVTIPRLKWGKWNQTVKVTEEADNWEKLWPIHLREDSPEVLLTDSDVGKDAIWRLKAFIHETVKFLCGYPKELLEEVKE